MSLAALIATVDPADRRHLTLPKLRWLKRHSNFPVDCCKIVTPLRLRRRLTKPASRGAAGSTGNQYPKSLNNTLTRSENKT